MDCISTVKIKYIYQFVLSAHRYTFMPTFFYWQPCAVMVQDMSSMSVERKPAPYPKVLIPLEMRYSMSRNSPAPSSILGHFLGFDVNTGHFPLLDKLGYTTETTKQQPTP